MKTLRIKKEYKSDFRIAFMGFSFVFAGLFVLIVGIIKKWYFGWMGILTCIGLIGFGIMQIYEYFKDKKKFETIELNVLDYKELK